MLALLQHIIPLVAGIAMRIFNETAKAKREDERMKMALIAKKTEILNAQHEKVAASTFLQTVMMMLITAALAVLIAFPVLAVALEVPLVVLWEKTVTSGFWIFKSTSQVQEWKEITGLYLPEQFSFVIMAAIEFTFGAIIGGLGRR